MKRKSYCKQIKGFYNLYIIYLNTIKALVEDEYSIPVEKTI